MMTLSCSPSVITAIVVAIVWALGWVIGGWKRRGLE